MKPYSFSRDFYFFKQILAQPSNKEKSIIKSVFIKNVFALSTAVLKVGSDKQYSNRSPITSAPQELKVRGRANSLALLSKRFKGKDLPSVSKRIVRQDIRTKYLKEKKSAFFKRALFFSFFTGPFNNGRFYTVLKDILSRKEEKYSEFPVSVANSVASDKLTVDLRGLIMKKKAKTISTEVLRKKVVFYVLRSRSSLLLNNKYRQLLKTLIACTYSPITHLSSRMYKESADHNIKAVGDRSKTLYSKFLGLLTKKGKKAASFRILRQSLLEASQQLSLAPNTLFLKLFNKLKTSIEAKRIRVKRSFHLVPFPINLKRVTYLIIK